MRAFRILAAVLVPALVLSVPARAFGDPFRGYVQLAGEVDVPSTRGSFASVGPGWSFAFGVGLRNVPLLLGIRAGAAYVGGSTASGPEVAIASSEGIEVTSTTVTREFEFRHLELTARLEPSWAFVRPYLEGSAGFVALWHVSSLDGASGEIDHWDGQRSVAPAWSASAGIDVLPWCKAYRDLPWKAQGDGTACLGFTIGAGSWSMGPLDAGQIEPSADGRQLVLQSSTAPIHEWLVFAAMTFAFDAAAPVLHEQMPP